MTTQRQAEATIVTPHEATTSGMTADRRLWNKLCAVHRLRLDRGPSLRTTRSMTAVHVIGAGIIEMVSLKAVSLLSTQASLGSQPASMGLVELLCLRSETGRGDNILQSRYGSCAVQSGRETMKASSTTATTLTGLGKSEWEERWVIFWSFSHFCFVSVCLSRQATYILQ